MRTVRSLISATCFTLAVAAPSVLAGQQPASKRIALEQYLDWEDVLTPQRAAKVSEQADDAQQRQAEQHHGAAQHHGGDRDVVLHLMGQHEHR